MQATGIMSAAQRSAIFALAKKAGLDGDALHDVVRQRTGEASIAKLSVSQAKWVIDSLKQYTGQGEPMGMATSAQRGMIYALCRELGWTTESGDVDMARLEGFVSARFKIDKLVWVDMSKAGRVIEALKAMKEGGRGERKRVAT